MPKNDPEMGTKEGKASDLETQFEEIVAELVDKVLSLTGADTGLSVDEFKNEIDTAVKALLDKVSTAVLMDPH